ncbi:hypothetical protein BDZ89DRAFT_1133810 [Hymenopellis radicata]|nr:hypothetical protein BDZ89DRAFT_1133810 [Hymenopellis radicata]
MNAIYTMQELSPSSPTRKHLKSKRKEFRAALVHHDLTEPFQMSSEGEETGKFESSFSFFHCIECEVRVCAGSVEHCRKTTRWSQNMQPRVTTLIAQNNDAEQHMGSLGSSIVYPSRLKALAVGAASMAVTCVPGMGAGAHHLSFVVDDDILQTRRKIDKRTFDVMWTQIKAAEESTEFYCHSGDRHIVFFEDLPNFQVLEPPEGSHPQILYCVSFTSTMMDTGP